RRVLRCVRHDAAAESTAVVLRQGQQIHGLAVVGPGQHGAAVVAEPAPDVAERGQARRGLPRAGLADECEHLARRDVVGHAFEDSVPGECGDPEIAHDECVAQTDLCHDVTSLSPRAAADASESVMRLVPTVSTAIANTGNSTPQGWTTRARRVSLIIRPQSAVGGWMPRPRNDSEATYPME